MARATDGTSMTENAKKGIVVAAVAAVVVVAGYVVYTNVAGGGIPANVRQVMCSETGDLFPEELQPGLGPYPHKNPKTGKNTLYPIEWCFNGECGKKGGTPVILNTQVKQKEPSYCPKCGYVVRFHNAPPAARE